MKGVYGRDLLTVPPERHRPVTVSSEACPICLSHSGSCAFGLVCTLWKKRDATRLHTLSLHYGSWAARWGRIHDGMYGSQHYR